MAPNMTPEDEDTNLAYIRDNKVHHLFEQLAAILLAEKPKNPVRFLIPVLQTMDSAGSEQVAGSTSDSDKKEEKQQCIGDGPKYDPTQEDRSVAPVAPGAAPKLKVTLVVFGLDNAGKSTFISAIGGRVDTETKPTVGFAPTRMAGDEYDIMFYDLGGGKKFRGIWPQYFADVHGIIWVVDAADPMRFQESKKCLDPVLSDSRSKGKPVLILANKQDTAGAATADDIRRVFPAEEMPCASSVMSCCALRPEHNEHSNIEKGVWWLLQNIAQQYEQLSARIKEQVASEKARRRKEMEAQAERVRANKEKERREAEIRAAQNPPNAP